MLLYYYKINIAIFLHLQFSLINNADTYALGTSDFDKIS